MMSVVEEASLILLAKQIADKFAELRMYSVLDGEDYATAEQALVSYACELGVEALVQEFLEEEV